MHPLTEADPGRIGRYRLTSRLGEGGMGIVYFGSTPGGRPVAIKVVSGRIQHADGALERFRREVRALSTVRSAYSASLIDCELDSPPYWFATEYVPGSTLDAAVQQFGALPVPLSFGLMAALAEGLSDIHVHGILHRDVKPQNIILSPVGPQLIDFGIARHDDQTALTQVGQVAGTPGFMSPEALKGEAVGPAADVFSLGATLAYAATGRAPYGEGSSPAVSYRVVHGTPDLEGVDPHLAEVIAACLDRDPARRPTPAEILEACQPHASLLEDPAYRRIAATPGEHDAALVPGAWPTDPDATSVLAPGSATPATPAFGYPPQGATPTDVLPSAGPHGTYFAASRPTETGTDPRTGDHASAGAPVRGLRGKSLWWIGGAVAAGAVTAGLLVLHPWQDGQHDARAGGGAHATSSRADATPAGKTLPPSESPSPSPSAPDTSPSDTPSDTPADPPAEKDFDAPLNLEPGAEAVAARISLVFQRDGNLVAYDENNQARWSTDTSGKGALAAFQPDGNLVVYDAEHNAVWASNTPGHPTARLILQSDGNITIMDGSTVLWAANTQH
ncbi:protein kinase [Streptomyces sp. NPDC047000]|uniref:protein kinase domain-containing protein n=1 Tax=Streptomyces sp. NPDC047000 TaxID=3155474 RepID=UPI0033F5EDCB